MALEFAADRGRARRLSAAAGFAGTANRPRRVPLVADWEPMVRAVLADRAAGEPVGRISARFHNALAELAVAVARHAGCPQVVLSGGCFQNALLTAAGPRTIVWRRVFGFHYIGRSRPATAASPWAKCSSPPMNLN